jgi:hypothetical protein
LTYHQFGYLSHSLDERLLSMIRVFKMPILKKYKNKINDLKYIYIN